MWRNKGVWGCGVDGAQGRAGSECERDAGHGARSDPARASISRRSIYGMCGEGLGRYDGGTGDALCISYSSSRVSGSEAVSSRSSGSVIHSWYFCGGGYLYAHALRRGNRELASTCSSLWADVSMCGDAVTAGAVITCMERAPRRGAQ